MVAVVRDGSFVGVLAEREEIALKALEKLVQGAAWKEAETLPDASRLDEWLKAQPAETQVIDERGPSAAAGAAETRRARYTRPYLAHASIAPSCAVAQWDAGRLRVWSHSQGIYNLRTDLALALALAPASVVVEHVEGAGCYGHNGADDAAFDAALLARAAAGRPVRLQWTRADELSWAPFGPLPREFELATVYSAGLCAGAAAPAAARRFIELLTGEASRALRMHAGFELGTAYTKG